jgi:hypothetical protein
MIKVIPSTATGNGESQQPILKLYQRLDTRGKTPSECNGHSRITPLPWGKNANSYPGLSYKYSEITTEHVRGKRLTQRNRDMLDLAERHKDKLVALRREWISVEWVGKMFNKTPNVPHSIAMAIHQQQRVDEMQK